LFPFRRGKYNTAKYIGKEFNHGLCLSHIFLFWLWPCATNFFPRNVVELVSFSKNRRIKASALSNRKNATQVQSNYMHVYVLGAYMDSQQRCSRLKLSVFTKY